MTSEVVVPLATALGPAVPLQVEISVQFLAGVAGTILLMLLFLMVVVLWDIALALRDVAEKIDYLEDDVDSDLASINGTLTRIYDRMGGGAGAGRDGGSGTGAGRESVSGAGASAGRESVTGPTTTVQGTDVVGGGVSASAGNAESGGVRPGDVRPGRARAHAAGVNAAVGGTTTVNPTAGGAFEERATPPQGRRRVGTAPTAATAGVSADATKDGDQHADVEGQSDASEPDASEPDASDGAGSADVDDGGESDGSATEDGDSDDGAADGSDSDGGAADGAASDGDAADGAASVGDAADGAASVGDADVTSGAGASGARAVEGPAAGSDEGGPSVDATRRNVGRFASDGSGDSAWYDVTMDVPRTSRTDLENATGDADADASGTTVDERLESDEVRNAYVDPVSAFGDADDDGEPTVGLDDLGSRFQPTSTDTDPNEDEDEDPVVDQPQPEAEMTDVDAEPFNAGDDDVDADPVDAGDDDVDTDDDATADATADPGTEVVDVETMPSDAAEPPRDDTDSEADDDGNGSEPDEANVDAATDDAESGDADSATDAGGDPDAVVADLSAAKARIRERHENEEGSLDYTSLQQEAAATPGVKGSGMPAEEMLDALAAAAVHDDDREDDATDVDAVEDALAERREETDDESDAGGEPDDTDDGADGEPDDGVGDADDGGIADLVNRELDTLTQEVGGTSMTPDVSDADLDAAVDELDDESYTFPLSGSSFDVTAETDSETATLSFTSEEPIDLGGARERLLTYQLRNYLDRDDTTHAELSVNENAVVLEIPAADGPAVDAWADAIVQIIDRTLYLSKDDD